jgi:hypothetical protein
MFALNGTLMIQLRSVEEFEEKTNDRADSQSFVWGESVDPAM